jgi:hypothetical protein
MVATKTKHKTYQATKVKSNGYWIGSPLARNQPHNFFKTNSKQMPVNMFKDNDRDGVANVFDCKPNNPNEEGLISAIVGAVGGLVGGGGSEGAKRGWSEGMAKETRFTKYYRPKVSRESQRQNQEWESYTQHVSKKGSITSREKEFRKALFEQRQKLLEKQAKQKAKVELMTPQERTASKMEKMKKAGEQMGVVRSTFHGGTVGFRNYQMAMERAIRQGKLSRAQKQKIATTKSLARFVFPVIPAAATKATYGEQGSDKKPGGGPGRPKGTVKYSIQGRPVGVFEWRRYQGEQKRLFRERLKQQQEAYKQQRQLQKYQQMPQYEQVQPQQQTQYQQQVPQEMQGQGVTPEYSQFPQQVQQAPVQQVQQQQVYQEALPQEEAQLEMQPVMPEYPAQTYPRQYPQQPQQSLQRPIPQIFRGTGGKPYPAVDMSPQAKLASTRQTIPYGYVESVDSFTGRRFLKQLPRAENWIRPKEFRQ